MQALYNNAIFSVQVDDKLGCRIKCLRGKR